MAPGLIFLAHLLVAFHMFSLCIFLTLHRINFMYYPHVCIASEIGFFSLGREVFAFVYAFVSPRLLDPLPTSVQPFSPPAWVHITSNTICNVRHWDVQNDFPNLFVLAFNFRAALDASGPSTYCCDSHIALRIPKTPKKQ